MFVYDIVSDIIGISFRKFSIVGFLVATAYVKGMYVVYELIIEEWYINPVNCNCSMLFNYQQIRNSYAYLSALLYLVYFAAIKMQVLLPALLLIVKHNY
jgi:hypothetical protein